MSEQDPFLFIDQGARDFTILNPGSVGGDEFSGGVGYLAKLPCGEVAVKVLARASDPGDLAVLIKDEDGLCSTTDGKVWRRGHVPLGGIADSVREFARSVAIEIESGMRLDLQHQKEIVAEVVKQLPADHPLRIKV
jgi:hypothetical protein